MLVRYAFGRDASSTMSRRMRLGKKHHMTRSRALNVHPSNPWGNEMDIPEDVMKAAREHLRGLSGEFPSMLYLATEKVVAKAIMAERERCAVVCDEWNDMKHVAYDLEFNGKLFPKKSPVHEALATTIRKGTTP